MRESAQNGEGSIDGGNTRFGIAAPFFGNVRNENPLSLFRKLVLMIRTPVQ